jgi:hypothetical protein
MQQPYLHEGAVERRKENAGAHGVYGETNLRVGLALFTALFSSKKMVKWMRASVVHVTNLTPPGGDNPTGVVGLTCPGAAGEGPRCSGTS